MDQFYRVFQNVNKMLINRGYEPSEHYKLSFDDFSRFSRTDLTILTKSRDNAKIKQDNLYVFFPEDEKVGVSTIRSYKQDMIDNNIKRAIIVIISKITPFTKSEISNLSDHYIEIFSEKELLINIVDHELVPKHELLTIEEKNEILNRYSCKEHQLPRISIEDPIAKYYGLKKRDVVKITRISETAGYYIYYRIVL